MKEIESGGGKGYKPPRKKKADKPRGKGPLAPKPSGVFKEPVRAQSVRPAAKPQAKGPARPPRTASALDVLPKKKGRAPKPYRPPVAEKVVREVARQRHQRERETRDTKGNDDRARVAAYQADVANKAAELAGRHAEVDSALPKGTTGGDVAYALATGLLKKQKADPVDRVLGRSDFYDNGAKSALTLRRKANLEAAPLPVKLAGRTVKDYVDTTANFVPSTYKLGETAVHDPMKAAGMLADPYVELAKHPVKSFTEHPGNSTLLLLGVKGGVGHGVGKTLRTLPSARARKLGSTARPVESPGNIKANTPKPYSKDSLTKAGQVAAEKVQARKARKKGRPATKQTMSEKDIAKRVDTDVAVGRTIAGHNEAQATKAAEKSLGRKPTAATSAVAQGLTDGSVADLQGLIAHYRAKAATLDGEALDRNQATVKLLEDALKNHDPAKVVAAAKAYSDMRATGEAETVASGFVKPAVAEATRLAGVAVRRHGVQTGAEAPKVARQAAKDARKLAAKDLRAAKRKAAGPDARVVTDAKVKVGQAQARARGNAARRRATILNGDIGKSLGATKAERVTAYIKAVENGDRPTMLRLARQEAADRAAVKAAKASVKTARVAQRQGPQAARSTAEAARRAHVDIKTALKAGAYVGPNGEMIPLSVVRGSKGPVEPTYVSHNPSGDVRPSAVPTEPPTVAVKAARSGKALDEGTIDLHPDRLIKQAADSQRKLDAAKNYNRFLDAFSHRKTKAGSPEVYGSTGTAEAAAQALRNTTGIDWVAARTFDGRYHLVPKAAATRLAQHASHTDNFMGAFTRQWSKNVLAFSPRWLAGQAIEPGFRAAVAHAGPRSVLTTRRVLKGIKAGHGQEAVDQFKASTMGSGLQTAARRPLEHAGAQKEAGRLRNALTAFSKKPGPHELGKLYNFTTNLTMGTLNQLVQNPSQYAMVGKAIRDSDLMSQHTIKLSQAAIDDFVRTGGKDINVQARLGREVERMAGKYNGFSPKVQAAIAGYTPFLAWTLSATNFLFNVLPRDHPVLTSLVAASNEATENWRKANGLQFDPFAQGQEGWLQGSVPGADGSHLRLGRYIPFGLGNDDTPFLGPYADAILPQMSGVIAAVKGEDFTGTKLTGAHGLSPSLGREAAAAAASIGKGVVPLATQILTLAGVHTPDNADSRKVKPSVRARARGQFDPFMFTPGSGAAVSSSGSGKPGQLPPGVSQRELDQVVREARKASSQPQVSQAEIDALLKAQGR